MAIIREEIVIDFQPYPKTNARCPVAACSFFAEHPYDSDVGNLNPATDFALWTVEMHLIKHRVLGDLYAGAGPGHDLGEEETFGQPTMPRDTAQPTQQQINTGPQNPKASPVQSMTRKKKKNILLNIENQLLERLRLRDEETDKLRNKGRHLRFLSKSKWKNLKGDAGQVCRWKWQDRGQACQQPINKRRRKCHNHGQVYSNVTVRCPYCGILTLEVMTTRQQCNMNNCSIGWQK